MPRGFCRREGGGGPCGRGRLSRLVEPAVLFLLATGQASHGYDIVAAANDLYLTESAIDTAAVYRVLRELEEQGCVESAWDTSGAGPARRVYQITALGQERLAQWAAFIERWAGNMQEFVKRYRASSAGSRPAAE